MRFYFSATKSCALLLGGAYAGMTGGADVFVDLSPEENVVCEMLPLDSAFAPVRFVIDGNFLSDPPVKTILAPTAVLVRAEKFIHADSTMRLVAQEIFPDGAASVFVQGTVQASWETNGELFSFPLADEYETASIRRINDCILFVGKGELCVVNRRGERLLDSPFTEYSVDDELLLLRPHFDCLNRLSQERYRLTDTAELVESNPLPPERAPVELNLYALLEGFLFGADGTPFVTEALGKRLPQLKEFLGNYERVLFLTKEVAGLAYPVRKNLYRLSYFTADFTDGKIDNIREKPMDIKKT